MTLNELYDKAKNTLNPKNFRKILTQVLLQQKIYLLFQLRKANLEQSS